jgi:LuxR family maltose regulon positive regulatory protein
MSATVDRFHTSSISFSTSAGVIARPRLLKLMEAYKEIPIILVTAPAGYGKSMLAAQWAEYPGHSVAWISLSHFANGSSALFAAISQAIAAILPDRRPEELTSVDSIIQRLRSLSNAGQGLTLIFDDYHCVENRDVHDAMDGLLAGLPERTRVIVISRSQPGISLARLRARNLVAEVTEQDLRFATDEIGTLIDQVAPGRLSPEQIRDLETRTEGWIAGIRLALASLHQVDPANVQSIVDSWPTNRWLDEYIVEEVLSTLDADVRDFVIRTSMFDWLEPDFCNEVLGIDSSAAMLDEISRNLVFVRSYRGTDETVAYHALFAESVSRIAARQLAKADLDSLHQRASIWFQRYGQLETAIEHAIAAGDWILAEDCVRVLCRDLMDRDRQHSRLHWLQKLPESTVMADPHLARWYISALCYTGQMRLARELFAQVEPRWSSSGDPAQLGYVASCRAFFEVHEGNVSLALRHVIEGLHHYPPDFHVERLHLWNAMAQWEFVFGNDEVSEQAYRQAERCRVHLPEEQWWWAMMVELDRANRLALRGDLRTAEAMYRQSLDRLSATYRSHEAKLRFRLAAIYLEWNDLDKAAAEVAQIESDLDTFPRQVWHAEALQIVARIHAAVGDERKLDDTLHRLRRTYELAGGGSQPEGLEALQVTTWLARKSIGLAREWAGRRRIEEYSSVHAFGHPDPRLALVQTALADGAEIEASRQLDTLIQRAESAKRWAEIVPFLVWQAVARLQSGDDKGAVASLKDAVRHGVRGGFVRSFLTPGFDLRPLLARSRNQFTDDEISFLQRIPEFDAAPGSDALPDQVDRRTLRESLSSREREVLALLEQGYTNPQVAEHLYVSLATVKKHVSNLLRKLGVPNRAEAVRKVRQARPSGPIKTSRQK